MAKKEHDEFASNIDLIDVLPPGLYEAVMVPKDPAQRAADLIGGDYLVRFEPRTLDDIRALGGNDESDDRKFETVARVSDINLGLYRMLVQPWVRLWMNEDFAATLRRLHPLRLQYEMFSSANPFMRPLQSAIGQARDNRQPVSAKNPLWQAQERCSNWTETWLDSYRDLRDRMCESTFDAVYGSPLLQTLVGLKATDAGSRLLGKDPVHLALVAQRIKELKAAVPEGGPREAAIRALLYLHQPDGGFDERGFNLMRRMREEAGSGMTLGEFKRVVREQFLCCSSTNGELWRRSPPCSRRTPRLLRACKQRARLIETIGLRSDEARSRLAELEDLIEGAGSKDEPMSVSISPSSVRCHSMLAGRQSTVERRGSEKLEIGE